MRASWLLYDVMNHDSLPVPCIGAMKQVHCHETQDARIFRAEIECANLPKRIVQA
jgi:hypothetical protein